MSEEPNDPNPLNPPTAEMREYWEALGRFIHHFARVEAHIAVNLWKLTRISTRIAQAVLSGVRVNDATSLTNRVLAATRASQATKDEFDYIFKQLNPITKVRNDILHYGTEFATGTEFTTSNRLIAYLNETIRETPVSATILTEMTDDLVTMQRLLGRLHTTGWVPPEVQDQIFGPHSRGTWRYKPPSQAPRRDKNRGNPPKRKPPPRSSPA
jgi:hypothetical protein